MCILLNNRTQQAEQLIQQLQLSIPCRERSQRELTSALFITACVDWHGINLQMAVSFHRVLPVFPSTLILVPVCKVQYSCLQRTTQISK